MKTKYFMRGLGTGLIVATLLLCMLYAYKMSDSQIISRAKELGMVYEKEEESPIISDEEETGDAKEEATSASEEESGETQAIEGETTVEPQSQENSTPSNSEQQSTEPQSVEQGTTDDLYATIVIDGGMNSVEVSETLKNLGVISDAEAFDYYLMKNGYAKRLQPGEHQLLKGSNFEEIAYILTR